MSFIQVNGIKFHVQQMGKKGPPVVMLHGLFIGSMTTWYFSTAPLLKKMHKVLLFDLRGHGKTEKAQSGYDLDTMAKDLESLTSYYYDQPVILIGHSYGALVALRFAQNHPYLVKRLVLVEAPLPPFKKTAVDEFLTKGTDYLIQALPEPIRKFLALGSRKTKRLLQTLYFLKEESTLIEDICSESPLTEASLSPIKSPALCIYGSTSTCLDDGNKLTNMLCNSELEVLEGGHYLHLDNPKQLNRLILDFIKQN